MINVLFERCSQPLAAINLYCLHIRGYVRAFCEDTFLLASVCNNQNKQEIGGQIPPGF